MSFRLAAVAVAAVLAASAVLGTPGTATAATASCVPPPVAHRGASYTAPENTRPAFRRALRNRVRTLEMDVRFTVDGTPVVIHDPSVDRTTNGSGAVADMTLATLKSLDAGSWFGRGYTGTRVPTVYQVLKDGVAYRARYFVELKVRPTPEQLTGLLARFDALGVRRRVLVTSAGMQTLSDVRQAAPDVRTALVDEPVYRDPATVLQYGTEYVVSHRIVVGAHTFSLRDSGIAVYSWTVDSRTGWRRMADEQVAGVITNRPVAYLAWARSVCS